jgi:hypothetical protein
MLNAKSILRTSICCAASVAAALISNRSASASVIYSTPGFTYTQNFDSLPSTPTNVSLGNSPIGWQNDNAAPGVNNFSIVGWYLFHPASLAEGGFDGHQRMRIGAGTVNTGAFMSYGNSADRAFGSQVSGTTVTTTPGQEYLALRLTNTNSYALTEFTLSYDGEQWRDGGATTPAPKTMLVQYSTTANAINDSAAYSSTSGLDFTTPVFTNTGSGAAVDGNVAGKSSIGPVTVSLSTYWQPNTDLWIRWLDPRSAGNNHGMGIDNVSFSATPEPASLSLMAAAAAMTSLRRRRR